MRREEGIADDVEVESRRAQRHWQARRFRGLGPALVKAVQICYFGLVWDADWICFVSLNMATGHINGTDNVSLNESITDTKSLYAPTEISTTSTIGYCADVFM